MIERSQNPNRRDEVDFHVVAPEHLAIHERLENWRRYVTNGRGGCAMAPMFRNYRSDQHWIADAPRIPVDSIDGGLIETAVGLLPENPRDAIRWHYVYSYCGIGVWKVCRSMDVRPEKLADLVNDGRTMLKKLAQLTNRADSI